jgi:hypothetical protein
MYCPVCKYEYREGFTICSQCNVELVESLDNPDNVTTTPPEKASNEPEPYYHQNISLNPISLLAKMNETRALYFIKNAFILGIFCGVITLIFTIYSIIVDGIWGSNSITSPGVFGFLDVIFTFGITFGIYKKSSVCAIIMFIYFLLSKIAMLTSMNIFSVGIATIFLCIFFNGIRGTVYYNHCHNSPKVSLKKTSLKKVEPNDNFGIASLVIAISSDILLLLIILLVVFPNPQMYLIVFYIISLILISITGLIFGILSLLQKNNSKVFSIIGFINAVVIICISTCWLIISFIISLVEMNTN